ncbi:N-acetylneuraminate synthase [Evansella caseinilytica]|uniref:N-acetylneuraminate synthase n=1 Tax=Evansella caseinilytica TaxID=1503961 RepID=A0A1H3S822_9BACI|nr:pseudaminic acid synthase [Evansella caseinilytica]SDZ33748.1 N-acetylneuraminate synthase [Evansella caseinilytica]
MKAFNIGNRLVGTEHPPLIIAEMSGNHHQSLERALQIVEAAAESGVDAIKLQTYTPDTMTLDIQEREFIIDDENSLWKGRYLYDLYKLARTPWEWHEPLFNRAKELGLLAFSTPFDESAVDFLETLNVPCYKIASFENVHLPLLRKVAATGKPVLLSAGMATAAELDEAVRTLRQEGCNEIVLLKCTSAYPASPASANLLTIPHMKQLFNCHGGLSDHTAGIGVAVTGVAVGATVIEKHFTLSRAEGGVDAAFSMEPAEMKALVAETRKAWESLGAVQYGPTAAEISSLAHRRSLYVSQDLAAGDVLTAENIRAIRPGRGLAAKYYDLVIGKRVTCDVKRGTPLSMEMLMLRD